jgi:anaerobic magnesium-protoporphyrin IX monomethyl ester cyclase
MHVDRMAWANGNDEASKGNTDVTKSKEELKILLVYPNLPLMLVPPLAMGLFTRILKEEGYQVDLFDTTHYLEESEDERSTSTQNRAKFNQVRVFSEENDLGIAIHTNMLEDFRDKVVSYQPDLLIFSVVEDVFRKTLAMLQHVEDLAIPRIIGGVFPTAAPERCIEDPKINLVGIGEGENVVVDVAEAVRTGRSLSGIPGTWFKDEDGNIEKTLPGQLVDIDKALPEFSLFDEARFVRPMGGRIFKTIPVETFRGCPYSCTFCNSPMQRSLTKSAGLGNFLRRKTIKNLKSELRELIRLHDPEFFFFVDDVFMARPRAEMLEFCDMYKEFGLPFWFNTRPENCDAESLAALRDAGCYRISFGIECGNEDFRNKIILRKPTNQDILDRFAVIADSGIAFSLNLIIGFPGETRDLIMDTVELVRSIRGYDALTVSVFTPYHGTPMREVAVRNGWLSPSVITKHTTAKSILDMPPPYLNADEIDGLLRTLPHYCYFPKSQWDEIRRSEIDNAEGLVIHERFAEIYRRNFLGENQDFRKADMVDGALGCRTNPKDAFRLSPKRLTSEQVTTLTT